MKSLIKLNNAKKLFFDFIFCDGGDDDPRHDQHEELSYQEIANNIANVLTPEELITLTPNDNYEQQLSIFNKAKDTYYSFQAIEQGIKIMETLPNLINDTFDAPQEHPEYNLTDIQAYLNHLQAQLNYYTK